MAVEKHEMSALGIPPDIVAAAEQVGMDMETLAKLCIEHSKEAAKSWLDWIKGKIGK